LDKTRILAMVVALFTVIFIVVSKPVVRLMGSENILLFSFLPASILIFCALVYLSRDVKWSAYFAWFVTFFLIVGLWGLVPDPIAYSWYPIIGLLYLLVLIPLTRLASYFKGERRNEK